MIPPVMNKHAMSVQAVPLSAAQSIDCVPTVAGKDQSGLKERRARGRPKANAQTVKRSIKSGEEQLVDSGSKPTLAQ